MPISKQQVASNHRKLIQPYLDNMYAQIDVELSKKAAQLSNPGYITVTPGNFFGSGVTVNDIASIVIQTYSELGWSVKLEHSQRDGSWFVFK